MKRFCAIVMVVAGVPLGAQERAVEMVEWGYVGADQAASKHSPAGAYSPLTNTMYIPMQNTCARVLSTSTAASAPEDYSFLQGYQLAARFQLAPGKEDRGSIWAISAETGETTWLHEQPAGTQALVATGGGLVFGGDANGRFRAFDQATGDQPRLACGRLSDHLCGRRTAICRGQHRLREQPVRLRLADPVDTLPLQAELGGGLIGWQRLRRVP